MQCVGGTNVSVCGDDLSRSSCGDCDDPGRAIDMIQRGKVGNWSLKTVVMDEADEMLSQGFLESVQTILRMVPKTSQICLFSATLPEEVLSLTTHFMNDPSQILVKHEELTLEGIQQYFVNVKRSEWKYDVIVDLYDTISVNQCIVYINNKQRILEMLSQIV